MREHIPNLRLGERPQLILLMTTSPPQKGPWIHGRHFLPLGLAYIGGALRQAGFPVSMLDNYLLELPPNKFKEEIKKLNPKVVGITCSSATYSRCVETAKIIKEAIPTCKVVVGGWHPTYKPESILQNPEIDYVVIGEGERAMVELVNHIFKTGLCKDKSKISGIAYKSDNKIKKNPPKFIDNLDDLPFPARDLMPIDLYDRSIEFLDVKPVDNMNIMRGCPFNCAFCETKKLWGSTCRYFSPARVVDEIEHLIVNYGTKGIYFLNDNFTLFKQHTMKLCSLIREKNLKIDWVCDTRADMVTKDLLTKMKAAGCKTIWFGGESGSPRILKKLNKTVPLEKTEQAIKLCRKVGISTACSFLMGIPGETSKDMEATFKFARRLNPDWCSFNIFVAVPGSNLYEEIIQKGLYDRVEDFAVYVKTNEFNYDLLLKLQRKFMIDFEKSPRRIINKIKREGFLKVMKKGPEYFRHQFLG